MTTQRTKKRSKSTQLKTANFVTKIIFEMSQMFLVLAKIAQNI